MIIYILAGTLAYIHNSLLRRKLKERFEIFTTRGYKSYREINRSNADLEINIRLEKVTRNLKDSGVNQFDLHFITAYINYCSKQVFGKMVLRKYYDLTQKKFEELEEI